MKKTITRKLLRDEHELTSILSLIIGDAAIDKVMQSILCYIKNKVHFTTCTIYEIISKKKIQMIYSNVSEKTQLLLKQQIVLANMNHFRHADDIYSSKDTDAVYHPVIINKELQYIFVFDDMEDIEGKKSRKFVSLCNDLVLLMSYVKNSCLASRSKYIDTCTGLSNELQLRKDLQYCIGHEDDCIFAIININNLETYNKLYGISLGDAIINNTANIVRKHLTKGEVAYRFFGDKLAVILFGKQYEKYAVLQNIIDIIRSDGYRNGEKIIYYTITIGALELSILKDLRYDNAYDRAMRATKIERGGLCFAGERRELDYVETLPSRSVIETTTTPKKSRKNTSSRKKNSSKAMLQASLKIDDGSFQGTNLFDWVSNMSK